MRAAAAVAATAALLLIGGAGSAGADVTIDNDLPDATLGHWSVDVQDGGESEVGELTAHRLAANDVIEAENIIYEYFSIVDPGNDGGGIQLSSVTTVAAILSGDDQVTSSGSFTGANGNTINWIAVSSIANGSGTMVNTFTFTAATGTLGVLRFNQYLDEDVEGPSNDVLFSRGSFASGDLELFTVDEDQVYGVSHSGAYSVAQGLASATFAGWAADEYSDLRTALLGPGAPVSLAGTIDTTSLPPFVHPVVGPAFGPNDITSTLAWDLTPGATTATIVTFIGAVPDTTEIGQQGAPAIPTLSDVGLLILASLVALFALRRLRA